MSEETKALVPIEEKMVSFQGDDISAALVQIGEEPQIYVPLRPICEYLGLTWSSQFMRVKRDKELAEALSSVLMTRTVAGRSYEVVCLQLEYLPGWLFGIDVNRVKPELQDKIRRYRRDCYKALWQAFQTDALAMIDQDRPTATSGLAQIRDMGLAIAQMAEQQMEMERNITRAHSRLDNAVIAFKNLDARVTGLENKLSPGSHITDAQAAEVSAAVKALADYLKSKDASKNHYQAVFGELYRRFSVSSYKNIRADQFTAVLKFLEDWKETK